jgi:uncharacterized protein YggU (UPF0235/DUF167 family)
VRFAVRVHPRASRERVVLAADDLLEVWVTAPAVDGRATRAVLALLAARLGLRPWEVALVRGERAREKLVDLPLDTAAVRRALTAS